jgi:hypothetical protein
MKNSPLPWKHIPIDIFPFGEEIEAADGSIVFSRRGDCHSTGQINRADYENGVGFDIGSDFCTPDQAKASVQRQHDDAELTVRACNSHAELLEALVKISGWATSLYTAKQIADAAVKKAKEAPCSESSKP